ncbi:flagellar hook-length control protein FliK [Hafnia alvei]|uniref:Flagellar hook-length control protein FliK n=1 Tax=Hafnia alvei TaxID=569 RepID=A0A1C6Z4V2_HAFAL|nr:flagellar hook-length control protein FliK [Hafnia alvei]SCM54085.1 flagellar hook-length control protein FliK [Hafnia alvei]
MSMMDLISSSTPTAMGASSTVSISDSTGAASTIGAVGGMPNSSASPENAAQFSHELLSMVGSLLAQSGVAGLRPAAGGTSADTALPSDESDADVDDLASLPQEDQQQMLNLLLNTYQPPTQPVAMPLGEQQPSAELLMLNRQIAPQPVMPSASQPVNASVLNAALNTAPSDIAISSAMTKTHEAFSPVMQQHSSVPGDLLNASLATSAPSSVGNTVASTVQNFNATTAPLKLESSEERWPQQLQNSLGERLQVQVKNQVQHATIRLDPPDMGKIDISIQFESGRLQVHINASQGEVYRALQQVSNELRQSLTDQNFVQVNVQVSSQNSQQQSGHGHQGDAQQPFILSGMPLDSETTEPSKKTREDESVLMTI